MGKNKALQHFKHTHKHIFRTTLPALQSANFYYQKVNIQYTKTYCIFISHLLLSTN